MLTTEDAEPAEFCLKSDSAHSAHLAVKIAATYGVTTMFKEISMSLFGKKQTVQALAVLLEDGRAKMNELMQKPKYRNYEGAEPLIEVAVRVEPATEPAFEAKLKVGLTHTYLLKADVKVQVKYDPAKPQSVEFDDNTPAILARNPQLTKAA